MSEDTTTTFNLSDTAIAHIAKILQVAILTGTDISDNLRQFELTTDEDGKLTVSENFVKTFNDNVEKMMTEVQAQQETITSDAVTEQIGLFE
tara:strand:- start:3051 stop:3326 length:276 start_codon:yes stop_codon:yes gene_type:complete